MSSLDPTVSSIIVVDNRPVKEAKPKPPKKPLSAKQSALPKRRKPKGP